MEEKRGDLPPTEIVARLRVLLKELRPELETEIEHLAPTDSIFKGGLVDSLTFVTLIELAEQEFGCKIPPHHFLPERLGTLREIADVFTTSRNAMNPADR